ncbi:tol-pal system-associated acyl-CoA thioesterase [Marinibactrum halimedae]|uniref:Tol-pal system-associated acyl-CoA thioesterase n=1 Tax=Marinibactrum halimedae TaxID=1444977 RepID=A0AA37T249_9GAMM|nr:tol-pal system-associated acyl-CoA thioesterase [Marinibactrum halimedae]MCD9457507.1 tol-pal system-associated acyl-CoA thioesterase [Marinibactrum halimedae]GLS25439.1 tol-pal system-associated acyl-CoA thioesterase [Marinibactrum halimedae]
MRQFSWPVRVYIEDTDSGKIVYYVNYLKFMERARTELLRSLGHGKAAVSETGQLMVVANAEVKYLSPARLDDELIVTTAIERSARTFLLFKQSVVRDGDVLCEGVIKVGCVNQDTMKPTQIPMPIRVSVNNWLQAETDGKML